MTQPNGPGWFADPAGTQQLRYFDGKQWTGNYSPLPPLPPAGSTGTPGKGGGTGKKIVGFIGAFVLLIIIGNAIGSSDDEADTTSSSATSTSSWSASRTAAATPVTTAKPIPPAGSAVRDGKFEFRVLGMTQQQTITDSSGYLSETAQGVYYVLTLSVTNIGDEARSYFGSNQKLIDTSNREYEADSAVDYYLNDEFSQDINPGNAIQTKVAFDVPPGTVAAMLEVHDSAFSGGAKVRL